MLRKSISLTALAASVALLAGCVVAPVGQGGYPGAPIAYVNVAPPAPFQEVVPVSPGVGYVWIGGYHRWVGNAYIWNRGYWSLPPRGYTAWAPGYWNRTHQGHHWVSGRWR
jgi:WXXGXW repeat (2 copies)